MRAIGINNGNSKMYNWQNDPELGSNDDNLILDLGDRMNELKALDPHWEQWFDETIPNEYDYVAIYPVVQKRVEEFMQEFWKALAIIAAYCPPEPELTDEQKFLNERKQQWQGFLSRMNAPEMVERRGTVLLTPYGWRKP